MHGAFPLVLLTTLIGVGQGLFLALVGGQYYVSTQLFDIQNANRFFGVGGCVALAFLIVGLAASGSHLGRPERAWRAATQWRTCWLSREVIALPIFMLLVFAYSVTHLMGVSSLLLGVLGSIAALILFLCTAMIYTEIKFLKEWSSPLTVANFILLGTASGATLATGLAAISAPAMIGFFATLSIATSVIAFLTRGLALLKPGRSQAQVTATSSLQTRWIALACVFAVPILLLYSGQATGSAGIFIAAFLVQYLGLIAERWTFFTQIEHPQAQYHVDVVSWER